MEITSNDLIFLLVAALVSWHITKFLFSKINSNSHAVSEEYDSPEMIKNKKRANEIIRTLNCFNFAVTEYGANVILGFVERGISNQAIMWTLMSIQTVIAHKNKQQPVIDATKAYLDSLIELEGKIEINDPDDVELLELLCGVADGIEEAFSVVNEMIRQIHEGGVPENQLVLICVR